MTEQYTDWQENQNPGGEYSIRRTCGTAPEFVPVPQDILSALVQHLKTLDLHPKEVVVSRLPREEIEDGVFDPAGYMADSAYDPGSEPRATPEFGLSLHYISHHYEASIGWTTRRPMMTEEEAASFVRQPWSVA